MSDAKRIPLRFWIGLHKDGTGRQCIVDFHGDTMDGVKAAWNEKNEKRLTTMETVIQPELSRGPERYLEMLQRLESFLSDGQSKELEQLLREVAMAAYESGLQNGGRSPKRP